MTVDEPVRVVAYDARWSPVFAAERQRLCEALAVPPSHIQHIGSTAVPGLESKPIIDLMLGVTGYPPPVATTSKIENLGYENLGEAGVPGRLHFRRRRAQAFNLHVVQHGREHWVTNLALRDYLRVHASARGRYTEAKRLALASGHCTLLSYSEAKDRVVNDLIVEALQWSHAGSR